MTSTETITALLQKYPASASARLVWIAKSSGGRRKIVVPNPELHEWLQAANKVLNALHKKWPTFMHGGIKKRSYVSYAEPHVGHRCVITVDIRSCFDSINVRHITVSLQAMLGIDEEVALSLAKKLCFQGYVAQGFSTSNFVCNLYLLRSLTVLQQHFSGQGLTFSNYVDDIAISGVITNAGSVINDVAHELSRAHLAINKSKDKIHVMPATDVQVICGLQVNKKLTVTQAKKAELVHAVTHKSMNEASINGWIANLKRVDPVFAAKLQMLTLKKTTR
ncbi:MAG TPA: reverse transcriptase domain-containing protein [Candidatus Saccharimonadales bacterium]|nr:reverse transcriptase domain-containing protein [Candidatus Saccharimonadales bacterium]